MTDFRDIKAITFDMDGVMTDGKLYAFNDGELLRAFNAKDTFAVRMITYLGLIPAVFTGGTSPAIQWRFKGLDVKPENIYMNCRGKVKALDDFCLRNSLKREEVLYIGDDIPDLPMLRAVGIAVAPADASVDAKAEADIISSCSGGHGCVREIVEKVMRAQGRWKFEEEDFNAIF